MSAVSTLIENAIVAALQGLNLVPNITIVARRVPTLPQGVNPPGIAVVVNEEGKSESYTATERYKTYPVAIVLFLNGGHKVADDPNTRQYRDLIEQQLDDKERVTFAGVSGFNRCTATGKFPFDPAALKADLITSIQVFEVEMIEQRAT